MRRVVPVFLYLAIFLLPFGQVLQFTAASGVHVYLIDVVVFVLAGTWLTIRKQAPSMPPLAPYIALFTCIGVVSLLYAFLRFNALQVGIGSLYLLRWISYAAIYFVVYEYDNKKRLLTALLLSGTISAAFGLVQYFLYPNLRNLMYLGWDPHEYRVFGTFFDSGFAGIMYVLTLLLIVYSYSQNLVTNKKLLILSGVVTYAAFALTYARSSYIAFIVAFLIFSILKKTYIVALFAVLVLTSTILLLPRPSETSEGVKLERTASVVARGSNYLQTLEIIADNPVLGVGFNTLRYENSERGFVAQVDKEVSHAASGSDSSLLFVAATTGILGLIAYMLLWLQTIRIELVKSLPVQSGKTDYSPLLVLPTIGALIMNSLFLNSLFYIWVMLWVWILLGVSHGSGNRVFVASPVTRDNLKSIFSFRQVKR